MTTGERGLGAAPIRAVCAWGRQGREEIGFWTGRGETQAYAVRHRPREMAPASEQKAGHR
jgi:hypothetical protein